MSLCCQSEGNTPKGLMSSAAKSSHSINACQQLWPVSFCPCGQARDRWGPIYLAASGVSSLLRLNPAPVCTLGRETLCPWRLDPHLPRPLAVLSPTRRLGCVAPWHGTDPPMTRSFLQPGSRGPGGKARSGSHCLSVSCPSENVMIFAWVIRGLPSDDRKEALAQACCGAWRPLQAFDCRFSILVSILSFTCTSTCTSLFPFSANHHRQVVLFPPNSTMASHLPVQGITDCCLPARCLCRCWGAGWGCVETTPQRPKILKPPPNHPPQNKPPTASEHRPLFLARTDFQSRSPSQSVFRARALFQNPVNRSSAATTTTTTCTTHPPRPPRRTTTSPATRACGRSIRCRHLQVVLSACSRLPRDRRTAGHVPNDDASLTASPTSKT